MGGKLTDTLLRSLKPTSKLQKIGDGGGLFLFVYSTGGMAWRYLYRFDGKQKTLTVGKYPEVSLKAARLALAEAKQKLENGIDPNAEKQEAKAQAKEEEARKGSTFEQVGREYFERKTEDLNPRYRKQYKSRLENILFPAIGDIPIAELKRTEILDCLRKLEAKGHIDTAHRVATIASQVCRYARDCGLVDYDVADNLASALSKVDHTPRAALTDPKEIGELLRAIETYGGFDSIRYCLRIMPYVFTRSWELRGAHWSEINFDTAILTVPASRMKRRREHLVPLARQVVALLRELQEVTGNGELVFPSAYSKSAPITDMGLLNALRRLGYGKGVMDIHGFRSIASTHLNEMGFRADIIEMQLSHAQKDSVRSAYNRALYLPERTDMMQRYADFLDGLRAQA